MQKISDSTSSANAEGEFTEGSAAAGVPATLITAAWLNGIQRELLAILTKAGLSPDANDFAQLPKAIAQLVKQSGQTAAAVFDVTTSQTLTAAHVGSLIVARSNSALTLTLPLLASVRDGDRIDIVCTGITLGTTIVGQGTDMVFFTPTGGYASWFLTPGDTLTLTKGTVAGVAFWVMSAGSALLRNNGQFTAGLTSNGFKKSPSGVLEQWGTATSLAANETRTVTLPVAYPSGVKAVVLTGDGANPSARIAALGTTTFQLQNLGTAAQNVYWRSTGY
ncbi:gp53-like domain-containing protein [Pseudomonas nitroreducens]|uniref:gp53-like domain-containing protein n=1 Tax=Pseudomonas nitroreducens TaxID=46680 RepID=UPI00147EF49D|nr:hypothetical protein [Pseudomonas nitroreducens]NNN24396.1 hypothetical protein [Pseudomonas nitroreducens]